MRTAYSADGSQDTESAPMSGCCGKVDGRCSLRDGVWGRFPDSPWGRDAVLVPFFRRIDSVGAMKCLGACFLLGPACACCACRCQNARGVLQKCMLRLENTASHILLVMTGVEGDDGATESSRLTIRRLFSLQTQSGPLGSSWSCSCGKDGWRGGDREYPTIMGVWALELARKDADGSVNTVSRNAGAENMVASDESDAIIDGSRAEFASQSTKLSPRDRNMTSSASWVRPRWDRDPRMVCDY